MKILGIHFCLEPEMTQERNIIGKLKNPVTSGMESMTLWLEV
jgi:hypothetical protein